MDDENLIESIEKALKLVKDIPDEYRLKTYEILLSAFIKGVIPKYESGDEGEPIQDHMASNKFAVPIDIKAFLAQNNLPEDILWKLFLVDGSEVRPIYNLKTKKKAVAQIQVACLLSLENALTGNEFEFSIEDVRTRVQALDLYISKNFVPTFRTSKNAALFTSLDDEEHVPLSPAGKTELADIIEELTE